MEVSTAHLSSSSTEASTPLSALQRLRRLQVESKDHFIPVYPELL